MMDLFKISLLIFVLIPAFGFLFSLFLPVKNEKLISRLVFTTTGVNLLLYLIFSVLWIMEGAPDFNVSVLSLYESHEYNFILDFYFDETGFVFLLVGSVLRFLITVYSRFYLHREEGYRRFFNTILFFYTGFCITVLAGNFETLFLGWECIGISSFLLISFYRDRYLPVRNSVKVFSVYRIGDVGILLAMWASHHVWNRNILFTELNNLPAVEQVIKHHTGIAVFISVMILIAASVKSAQFPFSYWLPRAMEGPTPSSAVFYGSLSVHFGVFLLLRTYMFWEPIWAIRILIILCGIVTSVIASEISRVQSTIKTQIAYASIAQIGIIFIEVALGLKTLALIHFAGNAFLRTYQLLISPSVITYLIRDQYYNFKPLKTLRYRYLSKRFVYSLYLLNVNEWKLDRFVNRLLFNPLKRLGKRLDFLTYRNVFYFLVPAFLASIVVFIYTKNHLPDYLHNYLPLVYSFIALLLVLKAFSEKTYPRLAWILVFFHHLWIMLAVSFNETYTLLQGLIFLSGIVPCGIAGLICLQFLKNRENENFSLFKYYGHVYEYPRLSVIFLLTGLGLMGFPVTLSFIGEDLLYSHIHEDQYILSIFTALSFIIGGIAIIRIYARLFLGPHVKTYHDTSIPSA